MKAANRETDPQKLARTCEMLLLGTKKLYESGPNEGDMWFFALYHHLGDCATALRILSGQYEQSGELRVERSAR